MCYDSNYQHEITYDFLCYLVSRGQAFALSFSVLITGNDGQVKRLGIHQPDVPYRFAVCVCVFDNFVPLVILCIFTTNLKMGLENVV